MKKLNKLLCIMVLGLSLSAVSCSKSYTITFDTNDGSEIAAVIVGGKNAVGTVTAPTKEGHNFAGWYSDEALTQEIDLSTFIPTADMTVYARWTLETFDVTFEENGGTAVQDITVDYGTPVTLPAAPTKEGYDFVKWYLDEELLKPYANQVIKEDTTLYAKWRSGLVYTGTEIGEATYDAETGSYSFSINLPLWGRFSLMYYGNLISANDENLIITGLFNPEAGADWTRNLYVDVPEGGSEIDYTTFLCCKPGIYDVTYNPTEQTLDIQDGNPPVVIPEKGLCYQYTEGAGADLVAPITVELDANNTYTFEVGLAQWRYVKLYYNGEVLEAADMTISGDGWVDGTYNASSTVGALYVADGPEQLMRPQGDDIVTYKLTYNPADNSLIIDNLAYEYVAPTIPVEGVYFTYERNVNNVATTFYPETSEITVEDGVWSFTVTLGQWKWVAVYEEGQLISHADMTISGDGWVDGTYNNSTNSSLYIDSDPAHFLRSQPGDCDYKLSYNPTDNSLVIDNLSIGNNEDQPKEDFVWTVANDQHAVIFTEANQVVDTLSKWRFYVVVDANDKIAYMCDMPINGYGNPTNNEGTYARHSSYANVADNPAVKVTDSGYQIVVPEGGFVVEVHSATSIAFIEAVTGTTYAEHAVNTNSFNVDNVRLTYDATAGTVTVSEAEKEPVVKENYVWTVANDQHAAIFTEANQAVDTLSKWRFYVVVDADGKIAYMCDMPINGYGNPTNNEGTYARHSSYANVADNPAVKVTDSGYQIVVPEGGFVVEVHSATSIAFIEAVTGTTYAEHAVNTNSFNVDNVRLAYDATAGTVTVSEAE